MKSLLGLVTAVFLAFVVAGSAGAEEVISAYHADIEVKPDASLLVTETITVNAEGNDIKRGIFRDFPLYAEDAEGRRIKVDFELFSVERDGVPEPYHTESISGGIRIYAGSADVMLPLGRHTYRLTYATSRQIRYFDDHDELYWNVTGNGWLFPINKASARVILADDVAATRTAVFTGALGDTGSDAQISSRQGDPYFETTRRLGPGEGLTIVVGLPKGAVAPPSSDQTRWWWLRDHAGVLIGVGGLVVVFLFYFAAWRNVGRDPESGIIVPRWDPPEGISPALVNYIDNKGFSGEGWTALSASALDLAVKGYIVLDDFKQSIVLRRTDKAPAEKLASGQANLLAAIGGSGDSLTIDKANGTRVQRVGQAFREAIEKEHRGKYYRGNAGYIVAGVALSIVVLIALFAFGNYGEDIFPIFGVMAFISVFLGSFAVKVGRGLQRGSSLIMRILAIVALAFMALIAVSVVGGILIVVLTEMQPEDLPIAAALGGIVLINALFYFLMDAPTPLGRKLMDGIEGLRIYMTLAEKDRMNMREAPTMSPQHFEKLLPYAVALGVEKPWTRTFETWLATAAAGAAAAAYQPSWYHGDSSGGFGDRIGGFSSSMASTIASTIPPPPKSSSSGFSSGGGFSGGGGGGGGGGGW